MPTTFVEEYSDDDEVIEVPYVKPKPPMITLSASEGEDETSDGVQFLKTNAKPTSKKGSRSKKEKRDQNVSGSSGHSMSKNSDSGHSTPKNSKKTRSSQRNGIMDDGTLPEQSNLTGKDHHNSSISMSHSTDTSEIEKIAELSQNVEPGVELKTSSGSGSSSDIVGTNSTTRSSEIVANSSSSVDANLDDSQRRTNGEPSEEFVPLIHISTDIFETGFTPSVCSSDDNVVAATQGLSPGVCDKGKKRTRFSPGNSGNPKKKSSANSAQEQSRSDLLKFMQHLGLPLQDLPALNTPTRKRVARKAKTPTEGSPLSEASPTASSSTPLSAFVSTTEESLPASQELVGLTPKKTGPLRKKARLSEPLDEITEDIVFTNNDLESISSNIQMNVIEPVRRSNSEEVIVIPSSSKSPSSLKTSGSKSSSVDKTRDTQSKRSTSSSKTTPAPDKQKPNRRGIPSSSTQSANDPDTRKRLKNPLSDGKNKVTSKEITTTPGTSSGRRSDKGVEALKIYPKKWTITMKKYYGTIKRTDNETCEDVQARQSNTSTKWRAPEDRPRRYDRYVHRIKCTNCNQMGHSNHDCPDKLKPKMCSFCGWIGHTADDGGRNCPNALCLNCGVKQHRFQIACEKCLYQIRPIQCTLCGVVGHVGKTCPDLWRRYHSTTENVSVQQKITESAGSRRDGEINSNKKIHKPSFSVCCANCGVKGHNYFQCKIPRYKSPCHPHKPFIINHLPPPPARIEKEPKETTLRSLDTGTEVPSKRKVTPIVDSASSVEMLTIQFDNTTLPVTEIQQSHNKPARSGANIRDIPTNISESCLDVEVIITLSTSEHRHLLRAIDENKADDLFQNISESQVNIEVLKKKCEVHLSGSEVGVDQARLDIFKLLLRLKAADIGHNRTSKKPPEVLATNERTTERINDLRTEPEGKTSDETMNMTSSSSTPSLIAQSQIRTRDPNVMNTTASSFQEDELPNMFDIDERVLTGDQRMLATMSMLQPTGPFSAGPQKEYIPIPIPVPVPVGDFPSYTSGASSGCGTGFSTFDPQVLPQAQAMARAYYQSSLEFPHLPQVLPTVFDTSIHHAANAPKAVPPVSPQDGQVKSASTSCAPSREREESPELEIIKEVTTQNASSNEKDDRSRGPRKLNNVRSTLTVTLLPSEWALFCIDKTQLLSNISKILKVDITLDKSDKVISIKGTSKEYRRLAQQKILEFLQAKTDGLPFNLCLTPPAGPEEREPDSTKTNQPSNQDSPKRSADDGAKLQSMPWPSRMPPTFPPRDRESTQFDQNRYSNRHYNNRDSGYHGHQEEYANDRSNFHTEIGSRNFYRDRDYQPPHRQQRNYYSGNRGDHRYERNYNPPHVSSDRSHGPNNYRRSQRYFQ